MGDLTHLDWTQRGVGLLHLLLISFSAWAVSVVWGIFVRFNDCVDGLHLTTTCRCIIWTPVLAVLVVFATLHWADLRNERWFHLELGSALWAVCAAFYNRHYVFRWIQWRLQICGGHTARRTGTPIPTATGLLPRSSSELPCTGLAGLRSL